MEDALDSLVAEIYDAAVEPALWPPYLRRLRSLLGGEFVAVISVDKSTSEVSPVYLPGEAPAVFDGLAASQVMRVPKGQQLLFGMLDSPVSTLSVTSETQIASTDLYRHWMEPHGIRDAASCTIVETAEHQVRFGYATSRRRAPITPSELSLIQRLSPHMRRAFMIGETLERARWQAAVALSALSEIETPILICDAAGRLVFANRNGEAAFEEAGPLTLRNRHVEPRVPVVRTSFAEALQRAGAGDLALGRRGIGVPLSAPAGGVHAYILPLRNHGVRRISGGPLVAIFLSTHKGRALPEEAVLMTLFDLTPTEATVMTLVGRGQNAPAVRAALGVQASTIKTHLSRIFHKTGCANQATLMALMTDLSLPIGADAPGVQPFERDERVRDSS